jgi:peptide/nickel transport system ATP-binding protein/oligopeptide transport system ATP-binding protein
VVEPSSSPAALLEVDNLTVEIRSDRGSFFPIEEVSFSLGEGEVLGLVGESGCGKSMTALAIMGLLPQPVSRIRSGRILFDGSDLVALPEQQRRRLRGDRMGMIFQEPMTSLNPVYRIGDQLVEALLTHRRMNHDAAWNDARAMLDMVGIPAAKERMTSYPHELSGGMRQRVMIAMALICRPKLLIADEPTTALDVSTQAQILDLLVALRHEIGMAILMITHDLGVIAEIADRVAVMYAGRIVENTDVFRLFEAPRHPYTHALMRAIPRPDLEQDQLVTIEGTVASPLNRPSGCSFRDRCWRARAICAEAVPPLDELESGHTARCLFPVPVGECQELPA